MKSLANTWIESLIRYEPGKPIEEVARELGFDSAVDILKLASNENTLGPSPHAIAAMREAAAKMHFYPDGGAFYLRRALAGHLGVTMDQVILGNGSNELIMLLSHVFLRPGANIVMSQCAFIIYKLVAAAFQAETVMTPMRDFTHDLDAMARAITPDTRLVYVANPNNPTGTRVEPDAVERFMDAVPEHVIVVFDEAYVELLPENLAPDTLKYVHQGRNVFVLRTFSKTYGLAGLRIGYAVSTPDGIDLLNRVRQPFNANAMAQTAALAALDDIEHVAAGRRMVREGVAWLGRAFAEMGLASVPSFANFMLVDVGDGVAVFQALQRKKVIVRSMKPYGLPDHIRVTVSNEADNAFFIQALKEVQFERSAS